MSVNLALANGTATGGGTDYGTGGAGNLQVTTDGGTTWADAAERDDRGAGSTSVLVRTPIVNDTLDENAETFTLTATRTAGIDDERERGRDGDDHGQRSGADASRSTT